MEREMTTTSMYERLRRGRRVPHNLFYLDRP